MSAKQRVTIIGGGLGAMAAAYALTAPEQNGRYAIDIYTMGWRLGGKGASGRNADKANRIEEHGLHIWFGNYDNAFTIMRQVYEELARPPEAPLSSLDTAFRKQNKFVLQEKVGDGWRPWQLDFPATDIPPGGPPSDLDFFAIILGWIRTGLERAQLLGSQSPAAVHLSQDLHALAPIPNLDILQKAAAVWAKHADELTIRDLLKFLEQHIGKANSTHDSLGFWGHVLAEGLKLLARLIWLALKDRLPENDDARRMWVLSYLGITILRGILLDELVQKGVDSINTIEGRAWFRRNASFPDDHAGDPNGLAYDSAVIQALYDATFSYPKGNTSAPNFSAAPLLRACLWLPFAYKGGFSYEMQAGMGDTVFTPFYLALLARGVRFHFFSQVGAFEAADGEIERVTITPQVTLKFNRYEPLVKVKDLLCWPSEPRYAQITQGEILKRENINLEHYNSGWQNIGPPYQLQKGRDFDQLVLAAPLPAHEAICPNLIAESPKWRAAVKNVQATRTLAAQLWFVPPRQALGVRTPPVITGSYVEPWASLADFSHLLLREDRSKQNVDYLVYTTGALTDDAGNTQPEANAYVLDSIEAYLGAHAPPLWPDSSTENGDFDWRLLNTDAAAVGKERLLSQYWRANIDLNELYILSTTTGIEFRPKTKASGYANLYFAGDWTDNGFNISSVEGAVMSGLQASRAISGYPQKIYGENPKSLSPSR